MPGSSPMTRRRVCPAADIRSRGSRSPSGIGGPAVCQAREKACSTSATAGPSSCTPVSRQGGVPFAGLPAQGLATHSPETKATRPSTLTVFRWSRLTQPKGLDTWKGLNTRISTPASRSVCHSRRLTPKHPSQS